MFAQRLRANSDEQRVVTDLLVQLGVELRACADQRGRVGLGVQGDVRRGLRVAYHALGGDAAGRR